MSWEKFFNLENKQAYFQKILSQVREERKHFTVYPLKGDVFKAFELANPEKIKVVILGQDPYPGYEIFQNQEIPYAMGLSFSVKAGLSLPKSLVNIFRELENDLGIVRKDGDLSDWLEQGVFLLNSHLTVRKSVPLSHDFIRWDIFTRRTLEYLLTVNPDLIFILWGKKAELAVAGLNIKHKIISSHPSPLAAHRSFFGSKPFSRTNAILQELGEKTINW